MEAKGKTNSNIAPVQGPVAVAMAMQKVAEQTKVLEQEVNNTQHSPELSESEMLKNITDDIVKEAMSTLQTYKQGKQNLSTRIVENEKWFKMQHWDMINSEKDESDLRPASGYLFNSLINKHADLMDNYPEALILPRECSDEGVAKVLSSIIPVVLQQNDYEQTYSDTGWYKLKTGTSVTGVFWDNSKLNGLGDITIKKCDILNLFWESGKTDIQDSSNVFYISAISNKELQQAYPQLKNLGTSPELEIYQYITEDAIDKTDKSVVVDWYYKKKKREVDINGIPVIRTILHYCKFCNGKVLYASENDPELVDVGFYEHGLYPFVIDVTFPEEGMLCGFGYVDVMKDCQTYIDKMEAAILSNALVNARPRALVNDQAGINTDDLKDPKKSLIHVNGRLDDSAYRELPKGTLSTVYLNVLAEKKQEIMDISGNTASSQGQASSVTSASGIASLQEAAGKLARDGNKTSYRAFKKIVELVIELMRQFYTEKRCFRITGSDGKYSFKDFDNSALMEQQQKTAFETELGARRPVFDVEVRPAKKSAFSKDSQNQMALQFYSAGFFAPANADAAMSCLNMMDFDGKEKVIETVEKNGTLFQQVQMLQRQVIQLSQILDMQNGTNITGVAVGDAQQTMVNQMQQSKGQEAVAQQSRGSLARQSAEATRNSTAPK